MSIRILHVLDESSNADDLEMVGALRSLPHEQHVVSLGHCSTVTRAVAAGIAEGSIHALPSLGWADPRGKRALKALIRKLQPTHVHAWGASAIINSHGANFSGVLAATFTHTPTGCAVRLLRRIALSARAKQAAVTFIAASASIRSGLVEMGFPDRLLRIIRPGGGGSATIAAAEIRSRLGIAPTDHPVLLHAGGGKHGRQDFALWTAAIIRQLFPGTRIILEADARTGGFPGLERFGNLPEENMLVGAPASVPFVALLGAADVLLVTATGEIATSPIRAAMRAGVPIVATPIACMTELLTHDRTALVARRTGIGIAPPKGRNTIQPRAIAAEVERLLTTPMLGKSLAAEAKLAAQDFGVTALVRAYDEVYRGGAF